MNESMNILQASLADRQIQTGGRGGVWLDSVSPNDLGGVDIDCAPEPTDEWTLSKAVIPDQQASILYSKKWQAKSGGESPPGKLRRTTHRKARFSLPGEGALEDKTLLLDRSTTGGDNTTMSAQSNGEDDDPEEIEEEDQLAEDEAVEPQVKGDEKSEKSGAPLTPKALTKKDTMKPRRTYRALDLSGCFGNPSASSSKPLTSSSKPSTSSSKPPNPLSKPSASRPRQDLLCSNCNRK
ncbi:hypothetical protein FRC09_019202 [Ceratobasidium sp. 395]|nr:hypothetical protein FRC09_019202 [Ceratobasidium sp. 395]